jgi:hypothetical protein
MKGTHALGIGGFLLVAGVALVPTAWADFEATGPDGARFLLKDNGTWQRVEAADKAQGDDKAKDAGEALLQLERKVERGNSCRFTMQLVNNLPYEIRSFVPYFAAYRANGVVYDTVSSASSFTFVRPGDRQTREFEVTGLACPDIARIQVVGGDRCEMGDLHRFSDAKGQCLARVRVVASDLIRFDK